MLLVTGVWSDQGISKVGETTFWCDAQANGLAIVTAIQAVSNVPNTALYYTTQTTGVNSPHGGSSRLRVSDRAILYYSASSGGTVAISIPAPDSSILLSDGETVDPSKVTAITNAVKAHGLSPSGASITGYAYGHLVSSILRLQ